MKMNHPLFALFFLLSSLCCGNPSSSFEDYFEKTIRPFYYTFPENFLERPDGVSLSYKSFEHPFEKGAIVFVSGWTETHLKYAELIYDLYQKGHSVYSMDHRGMGFSSRLTPNPQQVHVERFSDYVDDLRAFFERVILKKTHDRLYVFAHSMGGLVTAQYLRRFSTDIHAAIFSCPLFQLNTGSIPEKTAYRIVKREVKNGKGNKYALTQGDTTFEKASSFENQKTTHSLERWNETIKNWKQFPILLQGGSTNGWVKETLESTFSLLNGGWENMEVPSLVWQSSDDVYVINEGHLKVCTQAPHCEVRKIEQSYHELFLEEEPIRALVIQNSMDFVESY